MSDINESEIKDSDSNESKTNNIPSNATCWYCGGQLVWQSDFALNEVSIECDGHCRKNEECCDGIYTFLTCFHCGAEVTYSRRCDDYSEE